VLKYLIVRKAKFLLLPLLVFLGGCSVKSFPLIDPAGPVGHEELHLITVAFVIMLIPVVPVIFMAFWFAWHYRASNERATYKPQWAYSTKIELIIWLVPFLIVFGLSVLSWKTTHQLNPYNRLAVAKTAATSADAAAKPVDVDVIALNWKWLFIYPKEHIATLNQLVVPTGAPIDMHLTSDTVMTAFFIPRLGTQIYAMAGMRTKLHLMADRTGTFLGENIQISGTGYSKMHFDVIAKSGRDYRAWIAKVRRSPHTLDVATYRKLERPSLDNPVTYYSSVAPETLFTDVIDKYRHGTPLANRLVTRRSAKAPLQRVSAQSNN